MQNEERELSRLGRLQAQFSHKEITSLLASSPQPDGERQVTILRGSLRLV
jgi:hypothetical protein